METTELNAWQVMQRIYPAEAAYVAAGGHGKADFQDVARYLDPEVVLYQAPGLPFAGVWRGHAGMERFLNVFSDTWASMELLEQRHIVDGNALSVTNWVRFRSRSTGRELETWISQIIRVRGGRMLECRPFYWDPVAVAEACDA